MLGGALLFAFAYPPATLANSLADLTIDPLDFLSRMATPWDTRSLLGQDNGSALPFVPLVAAAALLQRIGVPLWFVGRILIASVLASAGLSMVFFTRILYPAWRIGQWIAAFAYMANIFVWVYTKDAVVLLIPYAVTPLLIAIFVRGLRRRHYLQHSALFALASLLLVAISPPSSAIAVVVIVAFALAAALRAGYSPWTRRIGYTALSAALTTCANIWWVIPLLRNLLFHTNIAAKSVENPYTDDAFSTYDAIVRLMGNPALYSGWHGQPYYPDGPAYVGNPVVVLATYILPVMGLAGIGLMVFRRVQYARLMASLFVVAVILAAAIQPPTGQAYLWLYNHAPGAIIFRASYRWVGVLAFVYALGAAYACEAIPRRLRDGMASGVAPQSLREGAAWLAVVGIVAQGGPLFTGTVVPPQRLYNIPTYWTTFAQWANSQPGSFRIAYLPGQYFSVYNWGQPLGEPATVLVHHPSVVQQPGPAASTMDGDRLASLLLNELSTGGSQQDVATLLAVLDIRYVVERRDVDVAFYSEPAPGQVLAVLAQYPFLRHVVTFGALDVYENSLWKEAVVRASTQAVRIEQPLVFDEVRVGGGSWTTNTAVLSQTDVSDFIVRARARITVGQYLGLGFRVGDHYVVAELRTDGSRLEHSVGNNFIPFGASAGSQAQTGEFYDLVFSRAGSKYAFEVNGQSVANAEDSTLGRGNVYLVGFNSSASVASLTVESAGSSTYSLDLIDQDIGREPTGWSAQNDTWTVRQVPIAQAVIDARRVQSPVVLSNSGPAAPSWSENEIGYTELVMGDFTGSVRLGFEQGTDVAVGFKTRTALVLGELRADGSRIEIMQGTQVRPTGTATSYRVDPEVPHSITITRQRSTVEVLVDRIPVARTTNAPSGPATFVISTFLSNVTVMTVSLQSSNGRLYQLDPSVLQTGGLPSGWQASSSWTLARTSPSIDSPSGPILVPTGIPSMPQDNSGQVSLVSSAVGASHVTLEVRSTGPFYITLDAAYDPGWVAHVDRANGEATLVHFQALGYANGWLVPQGGLLKIVMDYDGNPGWQLLLAGWALVALALCIAAVWPTHRPMYMRRIMSRDPS